jgi:hypothetical protein
MTATTAPPYTFTRSISAEWLGKHGLKVRGEGAKPPLLVANDDDAEWTPLDLLVTSVQSAIIFVFARLIERYHVPVDACYSEAVATVEMEDGAWRVARIVLRPTIVLADLDLKERVLKLVNAAVRESMIANALCTSVMIEPSVVSS